MKISEKAWKNYIKRLAKINTSAAAEVVSYMTKHDTSSYEGTKALIDYAYAISTKYGEAAAELSCQMYEEVAAASGVRIPAAEPAETATYGEVAKAIRGRMFDTKDPEAIGAAVGRTVKMAGVDTTMKNALRDGAEWAWIPSGDTCAFCLMLASNGWQKASKDAIRNGHAEHIHNNCDCTYAVRFDGISTVEGYDPEGLYDEYIEAGSTRQERLNAIRRKLYAQNPDYYRAQKRVAYARRNKSVNYDGIPKNWGETSSLSDDQVMKGVNPNYKRDLPEYLIGTRDDYTNNCVNCVVTYEMRKRGYDVTACSLGENKKLRSDPFSAWKGREPTKTSGSGLEDILEFMRKEDDGTRIQIGISFHKNAYIRKSEGHAFIAEKQAGETVFLNPQNGRKMDMKIFDMAKKDDTMYMKINDLEPSDRGVNACKKV